MKTWPLLFITVLFFACNSGQRQDQDKPVLKTDIIGSWQVSDMCSCLDTTSRDFPDINLEPKISFLKNGKFKKDDVYYSEDGKQKKVSGYTSIYKINGDTLFIYEPIIKHWYALYANIYRKGRLEIGSRKGYSHLDTDYNFDKTSK